MAKVAKSIAKQAHDREALSRDHWARGDQHAPLRINNIVTGEYAAILRALGTDGVDLAVSLRRALDAAKSESEAIQRMRSLDRVLVAQSEYMGLITKKHVDLANAYNALAAAFRDQTAAIQAGFDKQTAAVESHLEATRHTAEEIANGSAMMLLNLQAFDEATRELKSLLAEKA